MNFEQLTAQCRRYACYVRTYTRVRVVYSGGETLFAEVMEKPKWAAEHGLCGEYFEGFVDDCELWRFQTKNSEYMSDIYDDHIWQVTFNEVLKEPYHYLLMLLTLLH